MVCAMKYGVLLFLLIMGTLCGGDLTIKKDENGVAVVTASADFRGNLVPNPRFAEGLKHWKIRFPAPNETKYGKNHELVKVVDAPLEKGGKAVELDSIPKVAGSQGVKAVSPLIAIAKGKNYEFGVDLYSTAPASKIILEGYDVAPDRKETGDNQYPGFVRKYRAVIHVKIEKGKWGTASRIIKPPKGREPSHVLVKLYCYWPTGKVYCTNVFLRQTDKEPTKVYRPVHEPKKKRKSK